MKELQFKTNINCANCISKVGPVLNQEFDIEAWKVATDNPDKILTVTTELEPNTVVELVKKAGFEAHQIEGESD